MAAVVMCIASCREKADSDNTQQQPSTSLEVSNTATEKDDCVSHEKHRSWDLILDENELANFGAKLETKDAKDSKFAECEVSSFPGKGEEPWDSKSYRPFKFPNGSGADVSVRLSIFKKLEKRERSVEAAIKEGECPKLVKIKTNCSLTIMCKERFGDDSICYKERDRYPSVKYVMGKIWVEIDMSNYMGSIDDADASSILVKVARLQEQKIKKMLGKN